LPKSSASHASRAVPQRVCQEDRPARRFDKALERARDESPERATQIVREFGSHRVWCPMYRTRIERGCDCECDEDCGCPDCPACRCRCEHIPKFQTLLTPSTTAYTSNVATVSAARLAPHPLATDVSRTRRMVVASQPRYAPSLAQRNADGPRPAGGRAEGFEPTYPGLVSVRVDTYSTLDPADINVDVDEDEVPNTTSGANRLDSSMNPDTLPAVVNASVLVAQREAALLAWKQRRLLDLKNKQQKESMTQLYRPAFAPYPTAARPSPATNLDLQYSKRTQLAREKYQAALEALQVQSRARKDFEKANPISGYQAAIGSASTTQRSSGALGEIDTQGLYRWAYSAEQMPTSVFGQNVRARLQKATTQRVSSDRFTWDDEQEMEGESTVEVTDSKSIAKKVVAAMQDAARSGKYDMHARPLSDFATAQRLPPTSDQDYRNLREASHNSEAAVVSDRLLDAKLQSIDKLRTECWDNARHKLNRLGLDDVPEPVVQDLEALNIAQKQLIKLLRDELRSKYQLRKENEKVRRDALLIQQALYEQTLNAAALRQKVTQMEEEKQLKSRQVAELFGYEDDGTTLAGWHSAAPVSTNPGSNTAASLSVTNHPSAIYFADLGTSLTNSCQVPDYLSALFSARLALAESSSQSATPKQDETPFNAAGVGPEMSSAMTRRLLTSSLLSIRDQESSNDENGLTCQSAPDIVSVLTTRTHASDRQPSGSYRDSESEELTFELKEELNRLDATSSNLGALDPDLTVPSLEALLLGATAGTLV